MKLSAAQITELAEYLVGTTNSVEDGLRAHEWLDAEEEDTRVRVEEEGDIFLCSQCGWWCSNDEMNGEGDDQLCNDCDGERGDAGFE